MDRLYDDRLHRLIAEDFFRQRFDVLEEKRRELTRDLARHQHAEGAYMEVGSKLIELIAQAPQIFELADPEQRRELVGLLTSNRVLRAERWNLNCESPSTHSSQRQIVKMAGAVGFEPTCGGSKVRCLTTWRRPNGVGSPQV